MNSKGAQDNDRLHPFLLVVGLIAGFVARALVPGRDAMSVGGTILLGIVGSFVGGFIGYALFNKDANEGALQVSNVLGSIVGAVIVCGRATAWRTVAR